VYTLVKVWSSSASTFSEGGGGWGKGLPSIYSIRHPMRCPVLMHRMIAVVTVMWRSGSILSGKN
jgi:hypothetical protein